MNSFTNIKKILYFAIVATFLVFLVSSNLGNTHENFNDQKSCESGGCLTQFHLYEIKGGLVFSRISPRVRASVLSLLFFVFIGCLGLSRKVKYLSILYKLKFFRYRSSYKLFDRFTEIFSSGILHPKYY